MTNTSTPKSPPPIVYILVVLLLAGVGFGVYKFLGNQDSGSDHPTSSSPQSSSGSSTASSSNSDLSSVPLNSARSVDYSDLRYDLQKHNWQRANEDTMEALLKAFGPNSNKTGHIDFKEAANPPCQDLKTVDQLWSKASNGNLGFAAQRQVLKQSGDYRQAYNQMQWQRPGGEWLIQYTYDGHREHFKPGYEPDYGNPDKGHLPTFERGYNFKYSFDGTLASCGL